MKTKPIYANEKISHKNFIACPKCVLNNAEISAYAKILYLELLDRCQISQKNGWHENGLCYIYFTLDEVQTVLSVCREKAVKVFAELTKINLITKKRQGCHKPAKIFVNLPDEQPKSSANEPMPAKDEVAPANISDVQVRLTDSNKNKTFIKYNINNPIKSLDKIEIEKEKDICTEINNALLQSPDYSDLINFTPVQLEIYENIITSLYEMCCRDVITKKRKYRAELIYGYVKRIINEGLLFNFATFTVDDIANASNIKYFKNYIFETIANNLPHHIVRWNNFVKSTMYKNCTSFHNYTNR